MKLWEQYFTPTTVQEAVDLLQQHAGKARIIGGGTDLLVEMRESHAPPIPALIDVTAIPDLITIQAVDGRAILGAGVTHTQIVKSELLAQGATCLVEGCGVIGGPQVRNVATLAGNVAHALPAGDGTTSLVALDAQADIVQDGVAKTLPLADLYLGPGKSLLDSTKDILVRIHFALTQPQQGSAFSRIMRPQGVALPVLGCAVWVEVDAEGKTYTDARISIAPIAPTPQRVTAAEQLLIGQPIGEATYQAAIDAAQSAISPRTSKYRATADYRMEMIAVLLNRTLPLATTRAITGEAIPQGIGA